MTNLSRTTLILFVFAVIFYASCKKASPNKQEPASSAFHLDYALPSLTSGILETLMFSPVTDNSTITAIKTSGYISGTAVTFQLMMIDVSSGLKSITNYSLPSPYLAGTFCAVTDNNKNIWLGGIIQPNDTAYSKPFIIKLDNAGNVLTAKYFRIYDDNLEQNHYRGGYSLKVLNNGDLLYIIGTSSYIELIRMTTDGKIIWMKRYLNPTGLSFQQANSNIIETSAGDFIFLVNGSGLFKTDGSGNIIYQVALKVSGLSSKLYQLANGDLIITGENEAGGPQQVPYIYKLDPSNGTIISAKIMTGIDNSHVSDIFNDIQEVNGQLIFMHSSDTQYNTVAMDENLNILKIQRTLSHAGGFGYTSGIRFYIDAVHNAIYHNIDLHGPASNNGFQFLKTDLSGKSCHNDTGAVVPIPLADVSYAPVILSYVTVNPVHVPTAVSFVVTKSTGASVTARDGCNE